MKQIKYIQAGLCIICLSIFGINFPVNAANESINVYHTLVVTAPSVSGEKVTLQGIVIKNGAATGSGNVSVNGKNFGRGQGGGVNISGGSTVELTDCEISENTASMAGGVYIANASNVTFKRCRVSDNISTGNSGAFFAGANSVLTMYDSEISGNKTTGTGIAAALQVQNAKSYVYNTTVSGNIAAGNNCGAVYLREGSENYWVNCTVYGNKSGSYGGGFAFYGTAAATSKSYIVNSTITNNEATTGGGIRVVDTNATVAFYNTIISGNTTDAAGTYSKQNTIIGGTVYNASGAEVASLTFNPVTQLGALADNGGYTRTCLLTDDNPANTNGMSAGNLTDLGISLSLPTGIITSDQLGNSRETYTTMGAVVKAVTTGDNGIGKEKLRCFVSGKTLYVPSQIGDNINVYSIGGQLVRSITANSEMMQIEQLLQGNIYIVKVAEQAVKVIM